MRFLRFIGGPQPVLRLMALLLAVIAVLLYLDWQEQREMHHEMPPTCGDTYNPCQVQIDNVPNNGF